MNIYMASSYIMGEKITKSLRAKLSELDVKIFYPESIEISAHTLEEMQIVSDICAEKIRSSDILIAVYPFGISVSIEIGRFLENNNSKKLIVFDSSENNSEQHKKLYTEAMLIPHIYKTVYSLDELIKELYKIFAISK